LSRRSRDDFPLPFSSFSRNPNSFPRSGGAYLLSAKQRYNKRVISGVTAYIALGPSLEAGDLSKAKSFFTDEDEGTWKDLTAAGYLLSNAFRRSSTTPPDSLPAVKKWKAFQKAGEELMKAVQKKNAKGAYQSFIDSMTALDEYLEIVELPPTLEMK